MHREPPDLPQRICSGNAASTTTATIATSPARIREALIAPQVESQRKLVPPSSRTAITHPARQRREIANNLTTEERQKRPARGTCPARATSAHRPSTPAARRPLIAAGRPQHAAARQPAAVGGARTLAARGDPLPPGGDHRTPRPNATATFSSSPARADRTATSSRRTRPSRAREPTRTATAPKRRGNPRTSTPL